MMMNKKRKNFYEKENFEPPVKCFPDLKRKKNQFFHFFFFFGSLGLKKHYGKL